MISPSLEKPSKHGVVRDATGWHAGRLTTGAECNTRLNLRIPVNMMPPHSTAHRSLPSGIAYRSGALAATAAVLLPGVLSPLHAQEATSRVHALVQFQFADQYLTPRGMIVHNDGLTFQPLVLGFFNLYHGESFINDVTLVGGVWNDFSSSGVSRQAPFGSQPTTKWVEIDPIAGLSFGLGKHLKLDVTYTAFNMQVLGIPLSQHLEVKLSLDDSEWLKAFALHPYVIYWQELDGKATAAQVPYFVDPLGINPGAPPDSSFYFDLGIAPAYRFGDSGIKLEAPCRILLPDSDFYGEYYAKSSSVALYEAGLKASAPLKFMPKGYGFWNFYLGAKYMNLADDNLAGMQQFNAPGKATDDVVQFYTGLSVFF